MMFVSLEINGRGCLSAGFIEDDPRVRCCFALSSRHVERVRLIGDFCASGEQLVLGETQPGLWMAWLLLQPGRYRCVVIAQAIFKELNYLETHEHLVRQRFVLTIPNVRKRGIHAPRLDLTDDCELPESGRP